MGETDAHRRHAARMMPPVLSAPSNGPAARAGAPGRSGAGSVLRVLVVDDEPIARRRLLTMLAQHADVQVVGECEDGSTAATAIAALDPDLVLLDVQMPEVDG